VEQWVLTHRMVASIAEVVRAHDVTDTLVTEFADLGGFTHCLVVLTTFKKE